MSTKSRWQRSKARRTLRKALRAWESVQVELQGKYSVERMDSLKNYSDNTSFLRALAVVLLTPVPCLVIVTLLDCIPLQDPSKGLASSHVFWLRAFLMTCLSLVTVLEQLRRFATNLSITTAQVALITVLVAAGSTAWAFAMAMAIGFPVPFLVAISAPVCCSLLALCFMVGWSDFLKQNPDAREEIVSYGIVVTTQVGFTYVYPAFTYVFVNVPPSSQTWFALLLPLLKLVMKNWLSYIVRHMEDFKPEIVIFNVEIFHTLYVACCMQQSSSNTTTILLMTMDFLQSLASIYDVNASLQAVARIQKRIERTRTLSRRRSEPETELPGKVPAVTSSPSQADRDDVEAKSIPLLETLQYLIEIDDRVRRHSSIRLESASCRTSGSLARITPLGTRLSVEHACDFDDIQQQPAPTSSLSSTGATASSKTQLSSRTADAQTRSLPASVIAPETRPSRAKEPVCTATSSKLTEEDKRSIDALSPKDRLAYVQQMLQLLHLTEFVILVEFTEMMIPMVYCLYLLVMGDMPNRVYYAQMKNVDFDTLLHRVGGVMLYALLEVVSFVLLSLVLSKKLEISAVHQLAFVLETQWHVVQSKLVLWVVFSVQTSLYHFGADYSFQFAWLRTPKA